MSNKKERIRLTRIMVMEYEPDQKHYPGIDSIEGMARLDASQMEPRLWEDSSAIISDKVHWVITGKELAPQRQDSLTAQLCDLALLADQHGLRDAADYIRNLMEEKAHA